MDLYIHAMHIPAYTMLTPSHKHGLVHIFTYIHTRHMPPSMGLYTHVDTCMYHIYSPQHTKPWAYTCMHTQGQTHMEIFSDSTSGSLNQNLTEMGSPWPTGPSCCCYLSTFCLMPQRRDNLLRISDDRALKGLTWSSQ